MSGLRAKLADAVRLLRYGPTEARRAAERQDRVEREVEALRAALAQSRQDGERLAQRMRDEMAFGLDAVRSQVSALAAAVDRQPAGSSSPAGLAQPPGAAAAEEGFYPVLEAHFRGPEALVKERLAVYRDWVGRMPPGRIADLGCGRGEWLDLLQQWGRDAVGVDSNALVAQALRAKGAEFEQGDAVSWLQSQPDGALAGITAFHVAEHLPFGVLLRLLQEAHRALVPGGMLIMETPNPENVDVATRTFWVDPSHVRPLPQELLVLAARYCGFHQEALLRMNPPEHGAGAGRDYALVASKAAA